MNLKSVIECGVSVACCATLTSSAIGAGFSVGISPSRFELRAGAGEILRDTVTITNPGDEPATYLFRTTDWVLSESGSVEYLGEELGESSCRPWVRLERRSVEIDSGAQKNYRFELHVPEDAADGLCRFAILIEPTEPYVVEAGDGAVSMPILGRFAVLAYATIGDAAPEIEMLGLETAIVNGQRVPAVRLENRGDTYDRAFGQVAATDANGERLMLNASDFPVLPGRTETIALVPAPDVAATEPVVIAYPIVLDGRIEIGGERFDIEGVIE